MLGCQNLEYNREWLSFFSTWCCRRKKWAKLMAWQVWHTYEKLLLFRACAWCISWRGSFYKSVDIFSRGNPSWGTLGVIVIILIKYASVNWEFFIFFCSNASILFIYYLHAWQNLVCQLSSLLCTQQNFYGEMGVEGPWVIIVISHDNHSKGKNIGKVFNCMFL